MSAISSETLFHFTSSKENLLGILKNEFHPHYCMEHIILRRKEEPLELAFPMVCFCDIPLSQIKKHISRYGCYGIGMSNKWADKNGLNPVLYLKPSSNPAIQIIEVWNDMETVYRFMPFIKPFKSLFFKGEKKRKMMKFYDEREWRYVVNPKECDGNYFLSSSEYKDPKIRDAENAKLIKAKLRFEPKDIKYIIIKDEKEISEMTEALPSIKEKYDPKTIEKLVSKIITCEQINNDF